MLMALCVFTAGAYADTTTWNFSNWDTGEITSTMTKDGLTVTANVTIDGSTKTVDGVTYTKRLKTGGTGNADSRSLNFAVTGPARITVIGCSANSDNNRVLNISYGSSYGQNSLGTMTMLGSNNGDMVAQTIEYTGESATTIFMGSANSGINLYAISWEPIETTEPTDKLPSIIFWASGNTTVPTDVEVNGVSPRTVWSLRVRDKNNQSQGVGALTGLISTQIANSTITGLTANSSVSGSGSDRITTDLRWSAGATGAANIIVRFAGNDQYEPCQATYLLTVTKKKVTLTFANATVEVPYGNAVSNPLTKNPSDAAVTFTSSNENIATVDAYGNVTVVNAGECVITASTAETSEYEAATASYTLSITPSGADYTLAFADAEQTVALNSTSTNFIDCSDPSLTFAFKIADELVASMNSENPITSDGCANVVTNYLGTTTITVYPTNLNGKPYHEATYTLNVTQGTFNFFFDPDHGTLNVGQNVAAHVNFPTILGKHITSITAVSSNESVATVPANLFMKPYITQQGLDENGNVKYDALNPVITAVGTGTATITVTFVSQAFGTLTATYEVTVNQAGTLNFWWDDNTPVYFYEKDFILMPEVAGSLSGNGTQAADAGYIYGIMPNGTIEYNNKRYRAGSDVTMTPQVPDFRIENQTGEALIFLMDGSSATDNHLLIYGKKAGTVKLIASDYQNPSLKIERIITIFPKSDIDAARQSQVDNMTLPYTWDFTKPINTDGLNPSYWYDDNRDTDTYDVTKPETKQTYNHYNLGMGTAMNYNYANPYSLSELQNNPLLAGRVTPGAGAGKDKYYTSCLIKDFVGQNDVMPEFAGIRVSISNSSSGSWRVKNNGRIKIMKEGHASNGCYLKLVGGPHILLLPVPSAKATSNMSGKTIKLFVKGYSDGREVWIERIDANNSVVETSSRQLLTEDGSVLSFDIPLNTTKYVKLWIDGGTVDLAWIAYSTEAKHTPAAAEGYATYSYPWDLDCEKTLEANESLNGIYTSESAQRTVVNLTQMKTVLAGEGMLLNGTANTDYYFIATGHNTNSYECSTLSAEGAEVSGNKLTGSGESTITLSGIGNEPYTSGSLDYILAAGGTHWNTGETLSGIGFYAASPGATVPPFSAYLTMTEKEINKDGASGALFFNFDGTDGIMEMQTVGNNADGEYYNLNGVRVARPSKGVYIHNGRKVVVK